MDEPIIGHGCIICPHCHTQLSIDDEKFTYHGSQDWEAKECSECEKEFIVFEQVDRWWETKKRDEENQE